MSFKDGAATENKYFDQAFCGKVVRIGAIACAATLAGDVLFLVLVDPSRSRCPGWVIQGQTGSGLIWQLVAAVGLWGAWIVFSAIKWDWVARRYVDRLERDERLAESDAGVGWTRALINFRLRRARARVYYAHMIDFGGLLIVIMAGSVAICALPLLTVIIGCFW
jgi:hypothetical protein